MNLLLSFSLEAKSTSHVVLFLSWRFLRDDLEVIKQKNVRPAAFNSVLVEMGDAVEDI